MKKCKRSIVKCSNQTLLFSIAFALFSSVFLNENCKVSASPPSPSSSSGAGNSPPHSPQSSHSPIRNDPDSPSHPFQFLQLQPSEQRRQFHPQRGESSSSTAPAGHQVFTGGIGGGSSSSSHYQTMFDFDEETFCICFVTNICKVYVKKFKIKKADCEQNKCKNVKS